MITSNSQVIYQLSSSDGYHFQAICTTLKLFSSYHSVVSVDVEVLFYVHRNRRFIRDVEPRTSTSTFTQLLSSEGGC